ncbi:hypothetical protein GGR50DRAFT_523960 [Xylaria sp. CBS 124048]|nr:hypothetical protein GGR50DRAFT_523960 [Xylaria sp. CBS 124048]
MTEMAETAPLTATPKRKRGDTVSGERLSISTPRTLFSFQPSNTKPAVQSADLVEDGNSSPRSKVAQGFKNLAIRDSSDGAAGSSTGGGSEPASGGGAHEAAGAFHSIGHRAPDYVPYATRFDFDASTATSAEVDMQLDPDNDGSTAPRKRAKTLEYDISRPGMPATNGSTKGANIYTTLSFSLDEPRPRTRPRAATPPLCSKRKGKTKSIKEQEENPEIIDPVRAALTWQEDEITVYDPEDKDDDGTGINGIGFKPTAAVAYRRAQKRRQQLIEYKKREESEARAKRNQRRREQLGENDESEMARQHSIARVHFSDTPSTTIMTT